MITSQQLELLKVGLTEVFWDNFNKPSFYEKVFNVRNSDQAYEEFMHLAGLPNLYEWNSDGGELPIVGALQGDRVLFVHKDYGYMWTISKRLIRDNKYASVSSELVSSAGRSALHTVEALATSVFAEAFTVNGYDGAPLCGTHNLLGGGTYTNKITSALSETALEEAITKFRRMVNERGQPIVLEPAYLIVPPELEFTAKKLINSTVNVYEGSSVRTPYENVLRGMLEVIVNPYFTDANDWFIVSRPADHKLLFFWRERPTVVTEKDFRTQGISTAITMALSVGYASWRGVVGASVT